MAPGRPPQQSRGLNRATNLAAIWDIFWPRFLSAAGFGGFMAMAFLPGLRDPAIIAGFTGMMSGGFAGMVLKGRAK